MLTCVADVYAVLHLSVRVAKYLSVLMKFAPERAVKKKNARCADVFCAWQC